MLTSHTEHQIQKQIREYVYSYVVKGGKEHEDAVPSDVGIVADMLLYGWLPTVQKYSNNCTLCSLVVKKFNTRQKVVQALGRFIKHEYATWGLKYIENGFLYDSTNEYFSNKMLLEAKTTTINFRIVPLPNTKSLASIRGSYTVFVNPWLLLTRPAIQSIVSGKVEVKTLGSTDGIMVPFRGILGVTHFTG